MTLANMRIPRRELQRLPRHGGLYKKEPGVIEQFLPGERAIEEFKVSQNQRSRLVARRSD